MTRPAPTVRLIEHDAHDRPFHSPARWVGAPAGDLDRYGYRVDEYLISGEAHWYRHSPETGGAVVDPRHPDTDAYTTRAWVARPRDPQRFSGNVVVEQLNPSMRTDFAMLVSDVGHLAMADGDVLIGFSYKKVAVDNLRRVDPIRYADLDVPNDRIAWDLVRDVLALARGSLLGDDLAPAGNVIVTGGSQAGGFLHSFIVEGLHEPAAAGRPATADGYVLNVASGEFGFMGFIALHVDGEHPPSELFEMHECPLDDSRRISRGLEVPVVQLLSETESLQDWWVARPDSDAADDRYRCVQIPGRGHGAGLLDAAALRRDAESTAAAGIDSMLGKFHPPHAHPETAFLVAAVLTGMRRWMSEGVPMPRHERIRMDVAPYVRRDRIGFQMRGLRQAADELGHSLGGVRYPTIDHPVDLFIEEPDFAAITPHWIREPQSRRWIEGRYGSVERWLLLARVAVDDAIAHGTFRAQDRATILDFHAGLVAGR